MIVAGTKVVVVCMGRGGWIEEFKVRRTRCQIQTDTLAVQPWAVPLNSLHHTYYNFNESFLLIMVYLINHFYS